MEFKLKFELTFSTCAILFAVAVLTSCSPRDREAVEVSDLVLADSITDAERTRVDEAMDSAAMALYSSWLAQADQIERRFNASRRLADEALLSPKLLFDPAFDAATREPQSACKHELDAHSVVAGIERLSFLQVEAFSDIETTLVARACGKLLADSIKTSKLDAIARKTTDVRRQLALRMVELYRSAYPALPAFIRACPSSSPTCRFRGSQLGSKQVLWREDAANFAKATASDPDSVIVAIGREIGAIPRYVSYMSKSGQSTNEAQAELELARFRAYTDRNQAISDSIAEAKSHRTDAQRDSVHRVICAEFGFPKGRCDDVR